MKGRMSSNGDEALCWAQAPTIKPYPGGAQFSALPGWKPSEAALIDFGLAICSSCPPCPLPSPAWLICRTKSWLPPALLRWWSFQRGVAGWAAHVPRGTAGKRQPLLHVRGSVHQEQSRFYWCSKRQFPQCYAMTTGGSRFWGVETWTIWEAFTKKNMNARWGTGPWKGPWGLSFVSFPVNPPLVLLWLRTGASVWVPKQVNQHI